MQMIERKIQGLVSGIRAFFKETRAKGIVIGLSGGIDSSVALALISRAVGSSKILALSLPEKGQEKNSKDAKGLCKSLKVKFRKISIDEIAKIILGKTGISNGLPKANLKARIRMSMLYLYANSLNYIVAGTGNKSELMLGYFTKYGDGGIDFLPIGSIFKTEVYEIAEALYIPKKIIQKIPSANLYHGQTDEKELGFKYGELDKVLEFLEKKGTTKKSLKQAEKLFGRGIANAVTKRIKANLHKRNLPKVISP